ncbi:MAG: protein kinase [Oscillatoria sp. SIO1A7]|nr:protein kinase [Oscillatoria sp. SIO1A7]
MIYSGLVLEERYRVVRMLGRGGLAETWEVHDICDGDKPKVLKVLRLNSSKVVELFQREAEVLLELDSPGIPRGDGYFAFYPEGASEPLHCLVMEKVEGLDLQKWFDQRNKKPISQEQAVDWLKQLVQILALVHDRYYFHRDIKPSNIMLRPNGQLVLIDFGLVRQLTDTYFQRLENKEVTAFGTPIYMAPEQIRGKAVPKSDFFSLGRTFLYLLTGQSSTQFGDNPVTGELELNWRESAPQVSKRLADLIDDLMAPLPEQRPQKARDILERLAIVSIQVSIEPVLKELPMFLKFWAKWILERESKRWAQQIRTPKIALYGRSGSGKSSLINAILGKREAEVSVAKRGTVVNEYHQYSRDGWKLDFVDSRGAGDSGGDAAFKQGIEDIVEQKVDILLFVIPADERNVQSDRNFLTNLKAAHRQQHGTELPTILILNKIDRIEPAWWERSNLNLESPLSRKPKNAKEAKQANIRACITERSSEYRSLTDIHVPVCSKWNDYEDERYNIEELLVQIYKRIPDEAAKNGFGGATADKSLKKAIAGRFTSAAARFAFLVVWLRFDANAVLQIQKWLAIAIAQIACGNEDQSSVAERLLTQLEVLPTDAQSALSMTFAVGEAAISYFIDGEEIAQVKQAYDVEEGRLEPEFQEAFASGKQDVLRKLREIDADLHARYGVKRIYDEGEDKNDVNYVMQPL